MIGSIVPHPRLAADSVALDAWPLCRLLLMNDGALPLADPGAGAPALPWRSRADRRSSCRCPAERHNPRSRSHEDAR
jgi:hypothetical protein